MCFDKIKIDFIIEKYNIIEAICIIKIFYYHRIKLFNNQKDDK